jgi:hypothetical protein
MPYSYRDYIASVSEGWRGVGEAVRILVVLGAVITFICFFWILSFYSTIIIAKYIDDNSNSFIDIDDFDSDDNGADIEESNDNSRDPTIPLSNRGGIPLNTIDEEDKGLIFGLIPKKTKGGTGILLIRQRIQGLYQLDRRDSLFKVIKDLGSYTLLYIRLEKRLFQADRFLALL